MFSFALALLTLNFSWVLCSCSFIMAPLLSNIFTSISEQMDAGFLKVLHWQCLMSSWNALLLCNMYSLVAGGSSQLDGPLCVCVCVNLIVCVRFFFIPSWAFSYTYIDIRYVPGLVHLHQFVLVVCQTNSFSSINLAIHLYTQLCVFMWIL